MIFGQSNSNRNILSLPDLQSDGRALIEDMSRLMASPVYLGDHTALCRFLTRYKIYLDTRDEGFGAHVLLDGHWEIWITMFIAQRVKPGMRVIDVGANFGYYTILMADLAGPEGTVLAIEPNPAVAKFLHRTVLLNGYASRTKIVDVALGGTDGSEVVFFAPHSEPKNARVIPSAAHADAALGLISSVSQRSLDSLLADADSADFIKIDAEGAESDIFAGMSKTVERFKPDIILEFNALRQVDTAAFIDRIAAAYPILRHVGFDGVAEEVTKRRLLEEKVGEDWMLYLSVSA